MKPQTEAALKKMKDRGVKARGAYHLVEIIQFCKKDEKYDAGDKRRICPWGVTQVCNRCYHCKWFDIRNQNVMQTTGETGEKLSNFIEQFMTATVGPHKHVEDRDVPVINVEVRKQKDGEKP
ncbi:unnamed protein product [marine sediment metagenome]|uniref:Uncharacterized protein n=1 Tax=marine sediment metagenome TaxID=412755 RepID=X0RVP4_9ZZZZ